VHFVRTGIIQIPAEKAQSFALFERLCRWWFQRGFDSSSM